MQLPITFSLSLTAFAALLTQATALKITSPAAGAVIDSTEPYTITWTTEAGDPSTITLNLVNNNPSLLSSGTGIIASSISTSLGSYTAAGLGSYGTGWVIQAEGSGGNVIATSPQFIISGGAVASSTLADGQTTLVLTKTATPAAQDAATATTSLAATVSPASVSSGIGASVTGSVTTDGVGSISTASESATSTGSSTVLSGTHSSTISSGLVTKTTLSASQTAIETTLSSAAASSSSTGLAVAQATLRREVVMGVVGAFAGAFAVLS